jgi:hypothetical protein
MKTIRLNIQNYDDREKMVTALANSGYHVWVEKVEPDYRAIPDNLYYVCFENKEDV